MLDNIAPIAELVNTTINKLWPDKTEVEKQELAAALLVIQGQIETNKLEAQSTSLFVSGWRPFIGWMCGLAYAWNWVGVKLAIFIAVLFGHQLNLAPADISEMMPVLLGMLGLGGLRTYEKVQSAMRK